MNDTITLIAFGSTALIMALVSGVFLAFSDFVMRSLRAASPGAGIEAMQQINRKVYSSVFLVCLMGLAPVSIALVVYAWVAIEGLAKAWFVSGGLLYLLGTVLVTVLGNVPMNKRLDKLVLGQDETKRYWRIYARFWTLWNHVRTTASALAAAALLIGCALYV